MLDYRGVGLERMSDCRGVGLEKFPLYLHLSTVLRFAYTQCVRLVSGCLGVYWTKDTLAFESESATKQLECYQHLCRCNGVIITGSKSTCNWVCVRAGQPP